jgi:hypothetical protein
MFLMNCRRKEGGPLCTAFQRKDGTVDVSPEGGGFVFAHFADRAALDAEFDKVDELPPYRKGLVTADFLQPGTAIPCYANGLRWNGWGIPWFDEAGIKQVIASLDIEPDPANPPALKWADGKLMVRDDFSDANVVEYYESEPGEILVGDAKLRLWTVDGWTWDGVMFPDEDHFRPGEEVAKLPYGDLIFRGERAQQKYEECITGVWSQFEPSVSRHGAGRVLALAADSTAWTELPRGDFDAARNSSVVKVISENTVLGARMWQYLYWPSASVGLLVQEE